MVLETSQSYWPRRLPRPLRLASSYAGHCPSPIAIQYLFIITIDIIILARSGLEARKNMDGNCCESQPDTEPAYIHLILEDIQSFGISATEAKHLHRNVHALIKLSPNSLNSVVLSIKLADTVGYIL